MAKAKKWWFGVRTVAAAMPIVIGMIALPEASASDSMIITLDQATVLRLSTPAERVIVGNPAIADVTVDSPKLVSIFGKMAGETNLIILGARDQTLLSRPLVVINAPDHVVAVHVPGKDGPTSRVYTCAAGHCLRVRSPEDNAVTGANASASQPTAAGDQTGAAKPDVTGGPGNPVP
jgi:Flp pilus assembly secretin CpaC